MAAKKNVLEKGPFAGREGVLKIGVYRLIQQGKELVPERIALVEPPEAMEDEHSYCAELGPGAYKLIPHGVRMTHVGSPVFVNVKDPRTGQVPKGGIIPGTLEAMAGFLASPETQNYVLHRLHEMEAALRGEVDRSQTILSTVLDAATKLHETFNDKIVERLNVLAERLTATVPGMEKTLTDAHLRHEQLMTAHTSAVTSAITALVDAVKAETQAVRELAVTVRAEKSSADRLYVDFLQGELTKTRDELRTLREKHDTVKEEKIRAELKKDDGSMTEKEWIALGSTFFDKISEAKTKRASGARAEAPKLPAKTESADTGAGAPQSGELVTITLPEGVELGDGKRELSIPRPEVLEKKIREGRTLTPDGFDKRQIVFLKALRDIQAIPVEYDAVVALWESRNGTIDLKDPTTREILQHKPA